MKQEPMPGPREPLRETPEPLPRRPRVLPEPPAEPTVKPIIAAEVLPQQGRGIIASDTQGSYTGSPEDGCYPEQDADDL